MPLGMVCCVSLCGLGQYVPKFKQMNFVIVAVVKVAVMGLSGMLSGNCSGMQPRPFALRCISGSVNCVGALLVNKQVARTGMAYPRVTSFRVGPSWRGNSFPSRLYCQPPVYRFTGCWTKWRSWGCPMDTCQISWLVGVVGPTFQWVGW